MSVNLRWDTPGLKWDSGATWDGQQAVKPKSKIMNTKAIISFSEYSAPALSPVALAIHTALTLNAAVFGTLPVTLAALNTLINDYDTKLAAKADRSKTATLAFNAVRADLEDALGKLGNHVNTVANGDPVIVGQSGFPSYTTDHPTDDSPPPAPLDLRLQHAKHSGGMVARFKPGRTPSMNEVQVNIGDPMNEADWQSRGHFAGGRVELSGFTPGTLVWVRVRTLGLKNNPSDWSDPAQIRML